MATNDPPGKGLSVPKNPAMALRALNARHAQREEPTPSKEENNTTILQNNKPTDLPTDIQTDKPTNKKTSGATNKPAKRQTNTLSDTRRATAPPAPAPDSPPAGGPRIDGRTLRIRQETSDRTMVTSMRLATSTVEQLDEFCWRYRKRKQDVVQEALELYFAAVAEGEEGG